MPDPEPPSADRPEPSVEERDPTPSDTLSPSVRRLVKQYDLDITSIHGTGPAGRIRIADVMATLGGRAAPTSTTTQSTSVDSVGEAEETPGDSLTATFSQVQTARSFARHHPATTVFECDMTNAWAHLKRQRERRIDVVPTAYYVAALAKALSGWDLCSPDGDLGVVIPADDGETNTVLLENPLGLSFTEINDRLRDTHSDETEQATWLIHHHGLGGSIVALPTPLGEAQKLSLGIGKLRRVIALKNVDGGDAPRAAAQCYLSLSFHPDEIELVDANRLLAACVGVLEAWPNDS
jgi:2-oxoglutarate dehydrogenase E2 component (dihydrolipoamide succinyltransferase)